MRIRLTRLLTLMLLGLPILSPAQESERIVSFHSDIIVNDDASINVVETIQVYAGGYNIERGIFRKQPGQYPVLRVEKDGEPEPYHIEAGFGEQTVYFGDAEIFLEPGFYTYTFEYEVPHEVRNIETHDEVYWNVTGNGWSFPIESASATVYLPENISLEDIHTEAYTGYDGDQGQDYVSTVDTDGLAQYETTRPLQSYEGLTIVATFPKGHIVHSPWYVKILPTTLSSSGSRVALSIPVMLFIYFFIVWFRVGRDPQKGQITTTDHPPSGVSPALSHFIVNMGYDAKIFTVTLISLAVKGALRIGQETKELGPFSRQVYTLERLDDHDELTPEEKAAFDALFASGSTVEVSQENQGRFSTAQSSIGKSLKKQAGKRYFVRNIKYAWQGAILMYALLIWSAFLYGPAQLFVALFMSVWLSIWSFAVFAMWRQVFSSFRVGIGQHSPGQIIGGVLMMVFALPFTAGEVAGLAMITIAVSIEYALSVAVAGIVIAIFLPLLKAPTQEGRVILDQLEGFKSFLRGDGMSRYAREFNQDFQEIFEMYLPYAIALGLEQEWSTAFEGELNRASALPSTDDSDFHRRRYSPTWYNTPTTSSGVGSGIDVGSFGRTLSTAFASALSSASTSSSSGSSSGSGGGGSSGGGGGGGGGGGW